MCHASRRGGGGGGRGVGPAQRLMYADIAGLSDWPVEDIVGKGLGIYGACINVQPLGPPIINYINPLLISITPCM